MVIFDADHFIASKEFEEIQLYNKNSSLCLIRSKKLYE